MKDLPQIAAVDRRLIFLMSFTFTKKTRFQEKIMFYINEIGFIKYNVKKQRLYGHKRKESKK